MRIPPQHFGSRAARQKFRGLLWKGRPARSDSDRIIMAETSAFLFLCDLTTESECLGKRLMGSPQESALWP
jgi:hypothetical protein